MAAELHRALRAVDEALAHAPKRNGEAFSAALGALSNARDRVCVDEGRGGEARRRLNRLNACISIVFAGHFPIGEPPWDEIRKMRGWLEEMIEPEAGPLA